MEGYINENRWIDFSELPRRLYGSKTRIDWKNSVGYVLPFKYDQIESFLTICDYEIDRAKNRYYVYIYIENYLPEATRISTAELSRFELHRFLRHKIADYAPWMQQYLSNPTDAYRYCYCSNMHIDTKCPICGYVVKKQPSNMYYRGFKCDMCGVGISFPNRLMRALLTQLNVPFIPEVGVRHGFPWMDKYLYDFYFIDTNGQSVLIEMDGGFHRYEEQQQIDALKDRLAKANNTRLIRIDCMYQDCDKFAYIKDHIINSELYDILPLNTVDWEQCLVGAQTNVFLQVCEMYDNGESVSDISDCVKLSTTTIHKYLKQGYTIGVCKLYNTVDGRRRRKMKYIAQTNGDIVVRVFRNANELEELSNLLYGVHFQRHNIWAVCRGVMGSYCGLTFRYITKEEYEQHKMINNNEVVLKEAI